MDDLAKIGFISKRWIAEQLNQPPNFYDEGVTIPILDKGKLIACAAFTDFLPGEFGNSVEFHMAVLPEYQGKWRSNELLGSIFGYPFIELKCTRLWAQTTKINKKARRFCESLNFKREGISRNGWDGKHKAVIYSLLPEECEYLEYYKK